MRLRASLLSALMAFLIVVSGMLSAPAPTHAGLLRVDPGLSSQIASRPLAKYRVIVEVSPPATRLVMTATNLLRAQQAAYLITSLGGTLRGTLPIVGAAVGELSGLAILTLGANPLVAYVSEDTILRASAVPIATPGIVAVNAGPVWETGYTGRGVGVAVLDSGVAASADLGGRLVAGPDFIAGGTSAGDPGGHGSHVAGLIGGDGTLSAANPGGAYRGVAPGAKIVSVRVIDSNGTTRKSTVIKGIQWAVENKSLHNIRVLNLSLGGPAVMPHRVDPLAGAVEMAWRRGIVVVTTAGNDGPRSGTINAPGNDPYAITVGAVDDLATTVITDDVATSWTSRGPTKEFVAKPDLAAPGRNLVSLRVAGSTLDTLFPDKRVGTAYFKLSGTSMAAPIVSGIVALLLEKHPRLTPDQVKYILTKTARPLSGQPAAAVGSGLIDAQAALASTDWGKANRSLLPAKGFARSILPALKGKPVHLLGSLLTLNWNDVAWDDVAWDDVAWDDVAWDDVAWDDVAWDDVAWDDVAWDTRDTNTRSSSPPSPWPNATLK